MKEKCGQKKVWNPYPNDLKILKFLYDFKEGAKGSSIMKYCGLKRSTLYKRLNILRDKGLILDEFPVWKLVNGESKFVDSLLKKGKIFELHHPAYVIRLVEVPKWWNTKGTQMRNKLMMIKNYQFQQVNFGKNSSNPYIQLKNDKYVIQMYPESIIVIHRKRYHSNDPYDLTIQFMNDFYDLWSWFEDRMKFKFFKDGVPQMILRGHDYNRINDWMANYVKKKIGHKFLIKIGDGREVWIDLSEPFGKESNTPEIQVMLEKVTKDRVLNKPLLPSELQNLVGELAQIQKVEIENKAEYSRDLIEHKNAIKKMGHSTEANSKTIELLSDVVKELSNEVKRFRI